MDPKDTKVIFAAKVALKEYKARRVDRDLHFDKVIKAKKLHVDDGSNYHINFKTHLDFSLFPTYICDALVYENKNVFYVQKVECKRYVLWS